MGRCTRIAAVGWLLRGLELRGAEPGDRRDAGRVAAVATGHHHQLVRDAGLGERLAERLGGQPEIELVVVSDGQVDVAAEYLQRPDARGIAHPGGGALRDPARHHAVDHAAGLVEWPVIATALTGRPVGGVADELTGAAEAALDAREADHPGLARR